MIKLVFMHFIGGVRYREYPSSSAKFIPGLLIEFNEVVEVAERVFITGENSVFVHVVGTGKTLVNIYIK